MRDRNEVLDKFRELCDRYLKERKEQFLSKKPVNCSHNLRVRVKGKGQIGLCQNPLVLSKCSAKNMFVCNDDETCGRCKLFHCKNTDESVEKTFREILSSPARVGNDYPKLAMLIWFLQDYVAPNRWMRLGQTLKMLFVSIGRLVTFRWW